MLIYQALALCIYALCSLVLPLRCRWFFKIPLALLVLFCAAKPYIYNHFGTWLDPGLPVWAITVLESLYAALLIAVFCAMLKDIILLGYFVCCLLMHDKCVWKSNWIALGICVVALGQGFHGTLSQFDAPEIKVQRLEVADLPDALNGLRIVQLSDLHLGPLLKGEFLTEVVARCREIEPDLILLTGDYVDGSVEKMLPEFAALRELQAPLGVYAVTGNHEYYSGARAWVAEFSKLGLHFLNNEGVSLQKDGAVINVAGVPDPNAVRFGFDGPNPQQALAGLPEGYTILLSHQPAWALQAQGADLVLSGHTHGGTMFFLQPLIAHFNAGFVSGFYELDDRSLYVSNGTGIWSGFSCRFAVSAEITCFILVKKES